MSEEEVLLHICICGHNKIMEFEINDIATHKSI